MRKLYLLVLILLFLPSILAVNVKIEKTSQDEIMISDLNEPASFDLKIYNAGATDEFTFYNLFGFDMFPKEPIQIKSGETKEIKFKVYPRDLSNYLGYYTLQYFIKGHDSQDQEEKLTFEIINLKDAFEIGADDINPESNSIKIFIKNRKNFNFEKINAKISSPFFKLEKSFSLSSYEKKEFDINLNKEDFKQLVAGYYTLKGEINVGEINTEINGDINFVEKDIAVTTKREYGWVVTTKIIEKKNEGNVIQKSETQIKKNIISRLFTSFSPEPDIVERKGMTVSYTWENAIKPGETLIIKVKTNWLFPLLIIIFIVVIVLVVKRISTTDLVLKKKVNFVRTKGGEFALKVSLIINAQKSVERVNIVDKLPSLVKIHDRFSGPPPTRVDERTKRIEWNFEKFEEGETRMISYIIYSKLGILGKFALPPATAFYERNGKIKEVQSNRAFLVAEQSKEEE
ncbi:MAG: hypothetical protein WC584_00475 [Candidatus Pacearchaeota archaeon]